MYAIFQHGGRQFRVAPGDHVLVDHLGFDVGHTLSLEPVLFVEDGEISTEGARVATTVTAHRAADKIVVFKYKAKKRYRRTQGHRQQLTELRIDAVLKPGHHEVSARKTSASEAKSAVSSKSESKSELVNESVGKTKLEESVATKTRGKTAGTPVPKPTKSQLKPGEE